MGLTEQLANDLFQIQVLTGHDREMLQTLIIDFFAAAFAGYTQNRKFNEKVKAVVLAQGGEEESAVLFRKRKAPVRTAAFLNSVYGHGAELDDGNKKAAGHAGVHLIPAVFALAEKLGSNNDEVLRALAIGYEAYIRISSAAQPGMVARGFHSTGMAGTLACASACASLYNLDAQGIEDSIALSTTMTSGLLSYGDSRPYIKPLNPGKAAENGVFAAMLASQGVQGPSESLEGSNGWFHAVTDRYDEACLRGTDHLLLHDCYFKLYPSCRHTHCGIDAAVFLHEKANINDIASVNVYIYPNAIKLAGIKIPKNPDETKFSIQYTLARALIYGNYGIADMDPSKLTPEVLELIRKTTLIPDDSMENRLSGIRGARVELNLKNGKTIRHTVMVPKGDPENPLTREEIVKKLQICAEGSTDSTSLQILVKKIEGIEGVGRFENPMRITGEIE